MNRTIVLAAVIFFGVPIILFAHASPILPVHIKIKLDSQIIRIRIEANGYYWNNEILHGQYDPRNWPQEIKNRAMDYVNHNFILKADSQILSGKLLDCRYVQEPWKNDWGGKVILDMIYSYPAEARTLSGRASFYEEEWKEHPGAQPKNVPRDFRTILEVLGPKRQTLVLPIEKQDFEIVVSDARRTAWQTRWESFRLGIREIVIFPPFVMFIFSMLLFLAGKFSGKKTWILFFGLFLSGYFPANLVSLYTNHISWILLAAISGGILLRPHRAVFFVVVAIGAFLWGQIFNARAGYIISTGGFSSLNPAFFLAGIFAAIGILSMILFFAVGLYMERLKTLSETMWEDLFVARRKFILITFLILGIYNAVQ